MGYNLLINGVYWGYNPLTNFLGHLRQLNPPQQQQKSLAAFPTSTACGVKKLGASSPSVTSNSTATPPRALPRAAMAEK